jgi:GT2 family glycosyltransferase
LIRILDDIIAVLVLYKIDLNDSTTFNSLQKSLSITNSTLDIIVYDNSPTSFFNKEKYDNVKQFNIFYINNKSNPGVSTAYNVAAKIARSKNKKWLFLLDQDTFFPYDTFKTYSNAIVSMSNIMVFAPILKSSRGIFISPSRYKFHRGFPPKNIKP